MDIDFKENSDRRPSLNEYGEYPILAGVSFSLPEALLQGSIEPRLAVGRWRWVAYPDKGDLCWAGFCVQVTGMSHCKYGVTAPRNDQRNLSFLRDGDVVILGLKRSSTELRGDRWELLAPNIETTVQAVVLREKQERLRKFSYFKNHIRRFFLDQGFTEIETPSLVRCPGTEPYLDPIRIDSKPHRYLPTSPEIYLKKAIGHGFENIFEMKNCFRNNEAGEHHQLEFLMLEWYRSFAALYAIQEDLQRLIYDLALALGLTDSERLKIKSFSIAKLFELHCGFELSVGTSKDDLFDLAQSLALYPKEDMSWDDLFFLIFVSAIEVELAKEARPILVHDFPAKLAAYARISDQGWAQRFELYWNGLEICNAFQEVNSPEIQAARFAQDLQKKKEIGKKEVPLDPEFLEMMRQGFPPTAGIALGVERLFMAMTGLNDIRELKVFPYSKV